MTRVLVCIICPLGCELTAELEKNMVTNVAGFQCKKGKTYAINEILNPCRVLTTTMRTANPDFPLLPVRSSDGVPKTMLIPCMEEIAKIQAPSKINLGEPVLKKLLGLDIDMISCRTIPVVL